MGVLIRPFFSMFGELFLSENTNYQYQSRPLPHPNVAAVNITDTIKSFDQLTCSKVSTRSEFLQIEEFLQPLKKQVVRCPHESRLVWILMGLYQVVANALLLNLLIAMFSNTFNRLAVSN